jgi:hypothetical protein
MMGLEPTTFCMASRRSSQLSYIRVGRQYSDGSRGFARGAAGTPSSVPSLRVLPRETPGERADTAVDVELSEDLAVFADQLEEWAATKEHWTLTFRQGHDFDRGDNVEARLLHTGGEHTSSLTFRLDQVESLQEFELDLWLTLEERDGIAKAVHLSPLGLDVELHHIVGPALGETAT